MCLNLRSMTFVFRSPANERPYVKAVAALLRERGVLVFYDEFEEAALWGKNLYDYLHDMYYNRARYCVLFASEDYAKRCGQVMSGKAPDERTTSTPTRWPVAR
jgi:hypothetical protein